MVFFLHVIMTSVVAFGERKYMYITRYACLPGLMFLLLVVPHRDQHISEHKKC